MASPVGFKGTNASAIGHAGELETVIPVRIIQRRVCRTAWRLSWRERLSVLLFGRAWITTDSAGTHPPTVLQFKRKEPL